VLKTCLEPHFFVSSRIVVVIGHCIWFNLLKASVYYMYHHIPHQRASMLAKYCIYVFCMMLAINTVSPSGEFSVVLLEFFIDIIVLAALWSTWPQREIVQRIFPGG
jgi:hypothetical protein